MAQIGKQIIIIAGPNGAGKTTFANEILGDVLEGVDFINADIIAAELCPENPESVAVRAGRMMLGQIALKVEKGVSFALETTLSGRVYAKAIPRWRALGYEVILFFLSLPSPDLSVLRVASRVNHGGHQIPEEVIRRRFDAGMKNFYDVFRDLVDCWYLYDNSVLPAKLIESGFNESNQ